MTTHHSLRTRVGAVLSAIFLALGLTACAPEQSQYQPSGPGITDVMIPYATGGGTDTWGRFITQSFAERMDDVDRFQIENVPGGETITGTNAYVNSGVTNGDYLLVASASTYFQDMLDHKAAEFDFSQMVPLAFNGTGAVLWTSEHSQMTSVDDLRNRSEEATYGGMSASGLDLVALLALEALGVPVKGVFGFEGRGPSRLAAQRGEIDLDFQTTSSYLSQLKDGEATGEVVPLFSIGIPVDGKVERDPNLPEIPTVAELYDAMPDHTENQEFAYKAFNSFVKPGFFYQKGLWSNAGTDQAVVDRYDELVTELNSDEEFLDKADAALGGYELVSGKEAGDDFKQAMVLDPEIKDYIANLLLDKYGTSIR